MGEKEEIDSVEFTNGLDELFNTSVDLIRMIKKSRLGDGGQPLAADSYRALKALERIRDTVREIRHSSDTTDARLWGN